MHERNLYSSILGAAYFGAVLSIATAAVPRSSTVEESEGNTLRVYVTDASGKVPDLTGATALVYFEPTGGKRETLKAEFKTPPKPEHAGAMPDDIQVVESSGFKIGVEFVLAHEEGEEEHEKAGEKHEKDGRAGGKEEHGKEHAEEEEGDHAAEPTIPHFASAFSPTDYACSMKDAPPQPEPGKCPKCGMQMKAHAREGAVTVVLKIGNQTLNAKGFLFPPAITPKSFAQGLEWIDAAIKEMDELLASNRPAMVHKVADRITKIARAFPTLADAPKDPAVSSAAQTFGDLFDNIDKAADAGKVADAKSVVEQYRTAAKSLRGKQR